MVSGKHECRFKGFLRVEEQEWEWCFLYNGEISKLNCARCEIKKLDRKKLNAQGKTIA